MGGDRLIAITTYEYKDLAQKSIRADLLWQKCERLRREGDATIDIDEVAFILGINVEYFGLPFEDVSNGQSNDMSNEDQL